MVATGTAGAGAGSAPAAPAGGVVPFFYGSNLYVQKFATNPFTLGATQQEFTEPVTAGGFLRGVRLELRSKNGVGGVASADNPWNIFQSITLENVNGASLMFPMGGYAYYTMSWAGRPWHGDPARRRDFVQGSNPSCSLFIQPEIRHTAGVLANTDARSQYRIRYTLAPAASLVTGGGTAPDTTVTCYAEIWAQPDSSDLHGNSIEGLPPGLNIQTLRRRQVLPLNPAASDNQLQLTNVGNEIRCMALVVRDSQGQRQDYLSDPIRWNLDDRNLGVFSPDEIYSRMQDFYRFLADGTSHRPTGVYVFPRFYQPGELKGESWLGTNNATYLAWETATAANAVNLPGTVEVITDEVVPVGPVPMEMESI